jgi:hypothetical protein
VATREIAFQSFGCIAIPEDVARVLGMTPGSALTMVVDERARSLTLTLTGEAVEREMPALTACPIKP